MDDILLVGPNKPLGYLPLDFIQEHSLISLNQLQQNHEAQGCVVRIFPPGECHIYHGAYYVYHQATLQALLDDSHPILLVAGWSTAAYDFVGCVATIVASRSSQRPLFDLIGAAFTLAKQ